MCDVDFDWFKFGYEFVFVDCLVVEEVREKDWVFYFILIIIIFNFLYTVN